MTTGGLALALFDLARAADPAVARAVAAAIRAYRTSHALTPALRAVLAAVEEGCAAAEAPTDG